MNSLVFLSLKMLSLTKRLPCFVLVCITNFSVGLQDKSSAVCWCQKHRGKKVISIELWTTGKWLTLRTYLDFDSNSVLIDLRGNETPWRPWWRRRRRRVWRTRRRAWQRYQRLARLVFQCFRTGQYRPYLWMIYVASVSEQGLVMGVW